jgi:hypothetical protein
MYVYNSLSCVFLTNLNITLTPNIDRFITFYVTNWSIRFFFFIIWSIITHSLGKVQHNTASLECRQNKNHRDWPVQKNCIFFFLLTIGIVRGVDILTQKRTCEHIIWTSKRWLSILSYLL